MIENHLAKIQNGQSLIIWTDQLNSRYEEFCQFLNVNYETLSKSIHINRAKSNYDLFSQNDWTPSMEIAFKKWCYKDGVLMDKDFPRLS